MASGKTSRVFVWILLGLLIVGLAGFGATNFGGSVRSVGTVGDTEVDINRYARALEQEMRAIGAQRGQAVTMSEARNSGLDQIVLQRIVAQAALENGAADLGLSVGDEVVSREILAIPSFRGIDGEFDREAYAFTLENSGLSVADFEARIRAETSSALLQTGVISGVAAPVTYVQSLYVYAREERDITWARLTESDLDTPIREPSEDDLRTYHADNAAAFTLPETKVITYAWLTPDMIRDEIDIDQAALQERYQQRIDEFVRPERRLVERLVFGTDEEASAAKAAVDAGETDFDDLVAERGLTLEDVDLGDATRESLDAAGDAVFDLQAPGVVGPFTTSLGPALFRMNAILSAQETTLEDAEEILRAELATDRARRIIDDSITDIDDLLAGGTTIEELAAETDMVQGQIDWREDVMDDIAAYEAFREAAAALADRDFPEVMILEDGGIFAMRLEEQRPPTLQPLQEVRPAVITGWEQGEVTRRLAEQARTIADEIAAGREMAGIDLPLETDRGLLRDGFILGTPAGFISGVFEMSTGDLQVIEGDGAVFIVRLDTVTLPQPGDLEAAMLQQILSQQAAQEVSNDVLAAFTNALIAGAGVQINQAAINAVHAQFP